MGKVSFYDVIGLPDSIRHTLFVVALVLFLSPYLAGSDLGIVKVPDLEKVLASIKVIGPISLAAALLGYVKLWPAPRPKLSPLAYTKREKLRFGLTLGWELGRLDLFTGSPFPEAQAALPAVKAQISNLLGSDGFPKADEQLARHDSIKSVLSHYGTVDIEKHAAVLVGIAAMRASLIRGPLNTERNEKLSLHAYSAVEEIDQAMIPNKRRFFEALVRKSPQTVVELTPIVEATCR